MSRERPSTEELCESMQQVADCMMHLRQVKEDYADYTGFGTPFAVEQAQKEHDEAKAKWNKLMADWQREMDEDYLEQLEEIRANK